MREDWKPVAISSRDPAALRLTPIDAYLLSRIDGATSVGELALISGMTSESLWPILELLAREGMIEAPPGDVPAKAEEPAKAE